MSSIGLCEVSSAMASNKTVEPVLEDVFGRFMLAMKSQMMRRFDEMGLTPPMAGTLQFLEHPMSMRSLAGHVGCDPSNITGIADRLEAQGLVTRNADPNDRRVKLLKLTEEGQRMRATVFCHDLSSVGVERLTKAERAEFARLLAKMIGE
jgi:DNA-binding MarR family transcriptional regulator